MRRVLTYTAGLIVVYLVVAHATDVGRVITAGGGAYSGAVKVLQGR